MTKQKILLERGARVDSSRESKRTALLMACNLGFYVGGISFSLWPIILLMPILVPLRNLLVVHASLSQDGFQHKGLAEVSRTYYGLVSAPSFGALLNSIDWFWWQLLSTSFSGSYWDLLL